MLWNRFVSLSAASVFDCRHNRHLPGPDGDSPACNVERCSALKALRQNGSGSCQQVGLPCRTATLLARKERRPIRVPHAAFFQLRAAASHEPHRPELPEPMPWSHNIRDGSERKLSRPSITHIPAELPLELRY